MGGAGGGGHGAGAGGSGIGDAMETTREVAVLLRKKSKKFFPFLRPVVKNCPMAS
jgi:hypothetical protein